jgi:hypothetical protein
MATPRVEKFYQRNAWILLFALGIISISFSLLFILLGGSLLDYLEIRGVTGMTWNQVVASSPKLANEINLVARAGYGFTDLLGAVLLTMVSMRSYRKGERWAWYAMWIVPLALGSITVTGFSSGATGWPIFFGLFVVALLGVVLPYKKFFP